MTRARRTLLIVAALTAALTGCGKDNNKTDTSAAAKSAHAFVLTEWAITPPTTALKAGKVTITATNVGGETHELVIIRASDVAALPTASDGSVDEDKIAEVDKPGEIPVIAPGTTATTTLDLPVGNYVAICNLVDRMGGGSMGGGSMGGGSMGGGSMGGGSMGGHVHFRLGMSTRFTVS
ncbi:MAG: hypothetical protein HYR89_08350 [Actinobacteria bacterium]|nr:hypothetical protein [Actinomycetota bacterium]